MKILHTADWHIGNFPGPEKDGVNLRAQDTGNCINHLNDIALLEHPDIIVISGDVFHQARVWADRGLSEVTTAIRAFEVISDIAPIVVLRGTPNHDGEEQFKLLSEHFENNERVYIVTQPSVVKVKAGNATLQVACLPGFDKGFYRAKHPGLSKEEENVVFTQELGNAVMGLKAACDETQPCVLLAHYTVPGCNTESGQTPFLAQFEPVIMPETLDAAQFDLVCLGHIHRPQVLESCKDVYYSGALNAMNFNDEGQKRGFWIHEIDETRTHYPRLAKGKFYETPIREFKTIRMDDVAITAYNTFGIAGCENEIKDCESKIVRVIYSCNEDTNKAFNRAAFEHDLYAYGGAFWVSEITPDNITVGTSKNELSEKTNPETNLIEYLKEKGFDDDNVSKVVELGRPIIAEALANDITSRLVGMFTPIEIEVKNYRNYAEEKFNFKDITFCTINGKNGAGKSSLFMDAILDALYEEPREGELTAWIRADEKARSGSISFTFAIGDKTFRVVRTRAKSGKSTLNLSELVDGEWENRSMEKLKDTQEEIINILGMDSLTFRSCALIMQDQYGLFLQADKEARMSILGNILGLGIYGDMESISRRQLSDVNRKISFAKNDITNLQERLNSYGNPIELIEVQKKIIEENENLKADFSKQRDGVNITLNTAREKAQKAKELSDNINALILKRTSLTEKSSEQKGILQNAIDFLTQESEIKEKITILKALEEREKELTAQKALYDNNLEIQKKAATDIMLINNALTKSADKQNELGIHLTDLKEKQKNADSYSDYAKEYDVKISELQAIESLSEKYNAVSAEYQKAYMQLSEKQAEFKQECATRTAVLKEYERKTEILSSCNCIDIDNAKCQFLADAKEAAGMVEKYRTECSEWKNTMQQTINALNDVCERCLKERDELGYDTGKIADLRKRITEIEPFKKMYDTRATITAEIEQINLRIADIRATDTEEQKRLAEATARHETAITNMEKCSDFVNEYNTLKKDILSLQEYKEKESMLPVYREREATAKTRYAEIETEISEITESISKYQTEYNTLFRTLSDTTELETKLSELEGIIKSCQDRIDSARTSMGVYSKTVEEIEKTNAQIRELQDNINVDADTAATYEILKNAFSQDGIPHNIIRTIIPILTATSNTILGQMTGGKMGMQFVTDKVLKSNKKEVVTLDIVIEEYGKDTLPYLSKSGGEKVKASLSAILSLAEIKSTQAGIQLGMLFIDEPPFLDDDGTQAYCDALETIQMRYKDLKIMAITHDPTFKARFPQNVEVIKTEAGSKVIFE